MAGTQARSHSWCFPLGPNETVEIRLRCAAVTADVLRKIREYLNAIENAFQDPDAAHQAEPGEVLEQMAVGDIVQLKPSSDPTFGGLLMKVMQVRESYYRGYLLIPRRGGCMEAWYKVKPCEVGRIGKILYPEAKWGFRPSPA